MQRYEISKRKCFTYTQMIKSIIILPQFLQESLQKSPNFPVVLVTQFDKGFKEKSMEQESESLNEVQSKRLQ